MLRPRANSLEELARLAQLMSNAGGVAVAVFQQDVLVCSARDGSLAPPLGATLNSDSGITAACVQSRQVLQCCDAGRDGRVDQDVCRAFGIRSIVVVPVIVDGRLAGLIEVLSSEANAFNREHTQALVKLAAEAAGLMPAAMKVGGMTTRTTSPAARITHCVASASEKKSQAEREVSKPNPAVDDFLEVLQKSPSCASWDDLSNELARRMKFSEKEQTSATEKAEPTGWGANPFCL